MNLSSYGDEVINIIDSIFFCLNNTEKNRAAKNEKKKYRQCDSEREHRDSDLKNGSNVVSFVECALHSRCCRVMLIHLNEIEQARTPHVIMGPFSRINFFGFSIDALRPLSDNTVVSLTLNQ